MARIPQSEIERLKHEISVERLVEAREGSRSCLLPTERGSAGHRAGGTRGVFDHDIVSVPASSLAAKEASVGTFFVPTRTTARASRNAAAFIAAE